MSKVGIFSIELFTPTAKFVAREGFLSGNNFFCLYKRIPSSDFSELHISEFRPSFVVRFISFISRRLDWIWWHGSRRNGKRMIDVMSGQGINTILCHFGPSGVEIQRYLGNKNLKIIVVFHGYDISKLLRYKSYRKALKKIGADSRFHARLVADYLVEDVKPFFPLERIHVIKNGVELNTMDDSFSKTRCNRKDFIYFQGANLVEKKGHQYVLQAFSKLPIDIKNSSVVVFAGSGKLQGFLIKMAKDLNIYDRVHFMGHLSGNEYQSMLDNCDCFIHPSVKDSNDETEGIPTAIIEAMAKSKLVLTTRHAGIPELVEHGITGLLVEERDVEKLAEYMIWVQTNEEDCRIIANKARDFVYREFSLDRMFLEYQKIL